MLWLVVNAGSIHEDDDQRGFAHFLEHMAFNGTKHFPGIGVINVMEKAGMNFGADVNAHTSFDETVYQLTVPTDDSILFGQGMQIVQDWASDGILNDSASVAGERGVVMGEWRQNFSDSAGVKALQKNLERIFGKGSRYIDRLPIGDPALIQTATPPALRRFYHDWYRPDLMAVIAVGDFDPVQVEREIVRRFGSIPVPVKPRPFERPHTTPHSDTKVEVIEENSAPLIDLMWPIAPYPEDPKQAMKAQLLEQLTFPYLQRLATALSKRENRPFSVAFVGRSARQERLLGPQYMMRVMAPTDSLLPGARLMLTEIERLAQHGMPDSSLKRRKAEVLHDYTQAASNLANNSSQSIADNMVHHFLLRDVPLWTADSALRLATAVLPTITNADIAAFMRQWRADRAREVRIHTPPLSWMRFLKDTAVIALLDSITSQVLAAESPVAIPVVPVAHGVGGEQTMQPPGTITATRMLENSDVRVFTLSNGARVVFKPTWVKADEVIVNAYSPGGHSLLSDLQWYSPSRFVATLMTQSGSLGGTTHDELTMSDVREFSITLNTFSEEMVARGAPHELETMFRMMHLQFVNPAIDTARFQDWARSGLSAFRMSPADQLTAQYGEHHRFKPPTVAKSASMDIDQAMNVYRERFGDASDFTFFVVGATDSSTVVPLIERYLANLPSSHRETFEIPGHFKVKLPTRKSVTTTEQPLRSSELSLMSLLFRGDLSDTSANALPDLRARGAAERTARLELQTLSLILSRRLRQTLREDMAVTYSVGAPVIFYNVPEPRYAVSINLVTAPSVIDTSTSVVWDAIHALQSDGPTDDELKIAHVIMTRRWENAQESNQWWISQLIEAMNRGGIDDLAWTKSIPFFTRDEIRVSAKRYLSNTVYSQQIVKPIKSKK